MMFGAVKTLINGALAPLGYAVVDLQNYQQLQEQLKRKDKDLAKLKRKVKQKEDELAKLASRETIRADLERMFDELK
jgi:cell division protein FtsB